MSDIAERVGVSIKSVSRVLNGEGGVSADTAERILTTAHELGFRRNELARGLRRRDTTGTIGVVAQHTSTRLFDGLIRGIEAVAAEHGSLVLTAAARTAVLEQVTVAALSSRRVDGLVILPLSDDQSYLRAEQAAGLPTVFVDRPPQGITADTVLADNSGGALAGTTHLLSRGHRRVGLLGPRAGLFTVAERVKGFQSALRTASLSDEGLVRLDCVTPEDAQKAAMELLDLRNPPTAIFALSNLCTIGAARALRAAGLAHSVALVGFDDFEPADLLDPPVSVVAQDLDGMGETAARILFERLSGDDSRARTVTVPTRLIRRGSGELRPPASSATEARA